MLEYVEYNHVSNHSMEEELLKLFDEVGELRMTNPAEALKKARQALDIATSLKNYTHQIVATHLYGMCQNQTESEEAVITLHKAISLVREHQPNNTRQLALTHSGLGVAYSNGGNYQLGIHHLLRALSFDDCPNSYVVRTNLGNVYFRVDDSEKAIEMWEGGLARAREQGIQHQRFELNTLFNIALGKLKVGGLTESKQMALEVLESLEDLEGRQLAFYKLKTNVLNLLGEIYTLEDNFELALASLNKSEQMSKEQVFVLSVCEALCDKVTLFLKYGKDEQALACLHEALDYALKHDVETSTKQKILDYLADYYKSKNQFDKAFSYSEQSRQLLQEQFKESRNKSFQKIVAEREKEIQLLETKNKEIEAHNAILEQYARIISHDLREPVRGVTSFANLLARKYSGQLGEEGKEYIRFILSETNTINTNLARLLEYASFKKPKQDEIVAVKLNQIIKEIKQEYADLSFQLKIVSDDIQLNMKPTHAKALFCELIDNAVQFRKQDTDCRIEIEHKVEEKQLCISVKDYGIGIAPHYHKKIFKIFNKINKHEGEGVGVGLAICERIAHLYKGKIQIESVPDEFTTFHIKISK